MAAPLRFDILTTFPEIFDAQPPAVLGVSIPARARAAGLVEWHATNIRDFTHDKHQKTDARPYGGGPGMVMMCQPVWDAVMATEAADPRSATRVLLTPQGRPLSQAMCEDLARRKRLLLIAGHYEGIDERVIQRLDPIEVSTGDYVLSGGELAALVLMDAVIRLIPGVLGDDDSAPHDSFSPFSLEAPSGKAAGAVPPSSPRPSPSGPRLLDCPHYTRPQSWDGMEVPDVLLSGDHEKVARWRLERMLERTRDRRPDLLTNTGNPGPVDPD
jgi:tRNA (guanine37-N1)-methyltransferase